MIGRDDRLMIDQLRQRVLREQPSVHPIVADMDRLLPLLERMAEVVSLARKITLAKCLSDNRVDTYAACGLCRRDLVACDEDASGPCHGRQLRLALGELDATRRP
jgi:hypothetical protein